MKKYLYIATVAALFASCDEDYVAVNPLEPVAPTPDDTEYVSGSADFSTFVSVGNSLTAGYSDSALFIDGQTTSFPNTIAGQMALAGGGDFTQPMMADNLGGMTLGGNPISGNRLYLADPFGTPGPVPVAGQGTTEVSDKLAGPFNNMGVPGAKSYHLLAPGYGALAGVATGASNPYFARMSTSETTTVMADAMEMNPTFFSLWIGNNDILGFATSGGVGVDQTGNPDPSTYGGNDITDPAVFAATYQGLVQTLVSGGAKGIISNIPDITTIPYFTTVPYNALSPDALGDQIPLLNQVYGALNGVYAYAGVEGRDIYFSDAMANPVVVFDEELADMGATISAVLGASPEFALFVQSLGLPAEAVPLVAQLMGDTYGQSRQANAEDLLVFTSATAIGTVNEKRVGELVLAGLSPEMAGTFSVEGVTLPLEDKWVLTVEEKEMVSTAQQAYNLTISTIAENNSDIAFFDAEAAMQELAGAGVTMNGLTTTATYATGGAFSLDGVHPSPRGYAIISNMMMEVINGTFGSNLPPVNVKDFKGVYVN
ncbi:MAG: G-D-S-L family lipolytic protein [Flavobacteriaceae bacterium]